MRLIFDCIVYKLQPPPHVAESYKKKILLLEEFRSSKKVTQVHQQRRAIRCYQLNL